MDDLGLVNEGPALPVCCFQELTWFPGGGADGGAAGPRAGAVLGPDGDQVDGAGLQARQPSREVENPQRLGVALPSTAGPVQNLEPAHRSSEWVDNSRRCHRHTTLSCSIEETIKLRASLIRLVQLAVSG